MLNRKSNCTITYYIMVAGALFASMCCSNSNLSKSEQAVARDDLSAFQLEVKSEGGLGSVDRSGYTWLHKAAMHNADKISTYLIDQKLDVNAQTRIGLTPLHVAVEYGSKDVYLILKSNGARMDMVTKSGSDVSAYLKSFNRNW